MNWISSSKSRNFIITIADRDERAAVNAQLHNAAVAAAKVRPQAISAPSLTAAATLKFTTKTNVAVAVEMSCCVRVAFLSAAESGADQILF